MCYHFPRLYFLPLVRPSPAPPLPPCCRWSGRWTATGWSAAWRPARGTSPRPTSPLSSYQPSSRARRSVWSARPCHTCTRGTCSWLGVGNTHNHTITHHHTLTHNNPITYTHSQPHTLSHHTPTLVHTTHGLAHTTHKHSITPQTPSHHTPTLVHTTHTRTRSYHTQTLYHSTDSLTPHSHRLAPTLSLS